MIVVVKVLSYIPQILVYKLTEVIHFVYEPLWGPTASWQVRSTSPASIWSNLCPILSVGIPMRLHVVCEPLSSQASIGSLDLADSSSRLPVDVLRSPFSLVVIIAGRSKNGLVEQSQACALSCQLTEQLRSFWEPAFRMAYNSVEGIPRGVWDTSQRHWDSTTSRLMPRGLHAKNTIHYLPHHGVELRLPRCPARLWMSAYPTVYSTSAYCGYCGCGESIFNDSWFLMIRDVLWVDDRTGSLECVSSSQCYSSKFLELQSTTFWTAEDCLECDIHTPGIGMFYLVPVMWLPTQWLIN